MSSSSAFSHHTLESDPISSSNIGMRYTLKDTSFSPLFSTPSLMSEGGQLYGNGW